MYCCPPTGRKGRGGKELKKHFWRTVTNLAFLIGKCYPSGLARDCVGGTTAKVPKWVSNSWFWDSSITGMSYFLNMSVSVRGWRWQRWIYVSNGWTGFFMGPSTYTPHWVNVPAALIKCFNPKWKLNCWLLFPNVSLNFQSAHWKTKHWVN